MILSCCQKNIVFIDEKAGFEDKKIGFLKKHVKLERFNFSFEMSIPIPKMGFSALKRKLGSNEAKTEISAEQQVFQRLRDASKGNPGIAKAIWGGSQLNRDIEAEDIIKPQFKIDLDYEKSFLLFLILSMDSISVGELNEIETMDLDIAIMLHELEILGLISMQGDLCSIRPEALYSVEDHLKSLRLVV
jgi:hypothetical protein